MDKKIVIVDDSGSMRRMLEGMLKDGGFTKVELVGSGKEVIERCKKNPPDLLLLDIIMPEMNGMEVLRELAGKVKVIVISAVGQDNMVDEAKKLGAADYIIKPLDSVHVLETVKKHLGITVANQ
jgi:two-component system, chemotaxis family, chemotaxis protein CheY